MTYPNIYDGIRKPMPNRKLLNISEVLLDNETYKTREEKSKALNNLVKEYDFPLQADELLSLTKFLKEARIISTTYMEFERKSNLPMYIQDKNIEKLARILRNRIDYGRLEVFL